MWVVRAEPAVTLGVIAAQGSSYPLWRPSFYNFTEPSGTSKNKTLLPLQPLNSLLLPVPHSPWNVTTREFSLQSSRVEVACLSQTRQARGVLQSPWLPWQLHPWAAALPRPRRHPATPIQGAGIPDLGCWRGPAASSLVGGLFQHSGLSVLNLLGHNDLHLCSHSDLTLNLGHSLHLSPNSSQAWPILGVPPGLCSNTAVET